MKDQSLFLDNLDKIEDKEIVSLVLILSNESSCLSPSDHHWCVLVNDLISNLTLFYLCIGGT